MDDSVDSLDAVRGDLRLRNAGVTALGFSQGSATVCRWTAFGSTRIDRLIVWGGEVPPDLDLTQSRVAERLRTAHLTLVYGTRDELFTPKIVAATQARLQAQNILYALIPFDGGHEIHEATLRTLA